MQVLIKRLDPGASAARARAPRRRRRGPGARPPTSSSRPVSGRSSPTGIAIALPDGYAAFVHPRSGLAARHGVTLVNAPGTVDAGYRGEIRVTLLNTDPGEPVRFQRGDRIAQLVIQRVERAEFHEVELLPGSARGDGGFGSTGGHAAAGQAGRPTRVKRQGKERAGCSDDAAVWMRLSPDSKMLCPGMTSMRRVAQSPRTCVDEAWPRRG